MRSKYWCWLRGGVEKYNDSEDPSFQQKPDINGGGSRVNVKDELGSTLEWFSSRTGRSFDDGKAREGTKRNFRYLICLSVISQVSFLSLRGQSSTDVSVLLLGSWSNDDGDGNGNGNEEGKKAIGLDWQNNNFSLHVHHAFRTFLSRRCTTTTWKYLISRSVENGNTRQQLPFSFPKLWYSSLEFNSKTICQHLTN